MPEVVIELPDFGRAAYHMERFAKRTVPIKAANHAEQFFDRAFDLQGWTDKSLRPWKATKSGKRNTFGKRSQGILIGSGAMRASLRSTYTEGEARITVGNDQVNYANIHNNGEIVTFKISARSRKYFWAMYYRTGDEMWKAMALTRKRFFSFRMPKRQFIGNSRMLTEELNHLVISEFRREEFKIFGNTTLRFNQ